MSGARASVYVETTVIGHLVGHMRSNALVAARQRATRAWWLNATDSYRLLVSEMVIKECAEGDARAAAERLAALDALPVVRSSAPATELALRLVASGGVPASEPQDAAHISLAAVSGVDYSLTWNFKHIANPATRGKIESTCLKAGFRPPLICTPADLLGDDRDQPTGD
ncbi:MAG: hypothetical protein ACRCT8_02545 [Lacipirellulaceae bacterium]